LGILWEARAGEGKGVVVIYLVAKLGWELEVGEGHALVASGSERFGVFYLNVEGRSTYKCQLSSGSCRVFLEHTPDRWAEDEQDLERWCSSGFCTNGG
jgi:hypothetical protein